MMDKSDEKKLYKILDDIRDCLRSQISINEGIMLRLSALEKGAD